MAAPASWNRAPVYGAWYNQDNTLKEGTYKITVPVEITSQTDQARYPAGLFASGQLQVDDIDAKSLNLPCPCTDDPDNDPQPVWKLSVEITFADKSPGEKYSIDVPYANRSEADGGNGNGVNLLDYVPAQVIPQTNPAYKIGVPGGLAKLDENGDVVDADGNPVGGGGSGAVDSVAGLTGDVTSSGLKSALMLDQVNNTADQNKSVAKAAQLTTARSIELTGAVTGTFSFDGTTDIGVETTFAGGGDTGNALVAAEDQPAAWTALGTVPDANLPALAITTVTTVADQTARLGSTSQQGDVVKQSDTNVTYILTNNTPAVDANWMPISSGNTVPSTRTVAGKALSADVPAADLTAALIAATDTAQGAVELATNAEAIAGTDAARAVTAAALAAVVGTSKKLVIVIWDGTTWGDYDTDPNKVRFFFSLNDPSAPQPTWYNAKADIWFGTNA